MTSFSIDNLNGHRVDGLGVVTHFEVDAVGIPFTIDLRLVYREDDAGHEYNFSAHIDDPVLLSRLAEDPKDVENGVTRSLCYGNGAETPEVAYAILHWERLDNVLKVIERRNL